MGISDIATDSEIPPPPPPPPPPCVRVHIKASETNPVRKMLFHSHRHGALLSLCNSGTDAVFVFWRRLCSASISPC